MLQIRSILHPTDFSESAMQSLELARSLARDHGAKLHVLCVVAPVVPVTDDFMPVDLTGVQVEEMTHRIIRLKSTINDVPVDDQVVIGIPGRAIIDVADELKADLIVMGTEGRSGIARLVLGSVAEYVIRHATCPVLAVKRGAEIRMPVNDGVHDEAPARVGSMPL